MISCQVISKISPFVKSCVRSEVAFRGLSSSINDVSKDWTRLMEFLNKSRYKPKFLVDQYADFVCKNPLAFRTISYNNIFTILNFIAGSYHRPATVDWSTFRDTLVPPSQLSTVHKGFLITLSHLLAILGDYSVVRHFLNDMGFTKKIIEKDFGKLVSFVSVYSGTDLEGRESDKKFLGVAKPLIAKYIESLDQDMKKANPLLLDKALALGLGGKDFFDSFVWTRNGLALNYIIVMRKGNFPMSIRSDGLKGQVKYIENLNVPEEGKM